MNTPARFAPDPRRRGMIAKVHVAKKALGLIDDDYRAIIFDVAGKTSAADCTDGQLKELLKRFAARGFTAQAKAGKPRAARPADTPLAKKARAMWISLYHLCAVDDPSERALEAFAKRQLGCDRLQWANQAQGYKLVEALKAMAIRRGWRQDELPRVDQVRVLKLRLCDAILARLKRVTLAPRTWTLDDAAFRLLGMERSGPAPWALGDLDVIAEGLGKKLRAWRA